MSQDIRVELITTLKEKEKIYDLDKAVFDLNSQIDLLSRQDKDFCSAA